MAGKKVNEKECKRNIIKDKTGEKMIFLDKTG